MYSTINKCNIIKMKELTSVLQDMELYACFIGVHIGIISGTAISCTKNRSTSGTALSSARIDQLLGQPIAVPKLDGLLVQVVGVQEVDQLLEQQ